jgi:hypothetical protein
LGPAWRAKWGDKTNAAIRRRHALIARNRARGLAPDLAYAKGYKVGYARAWRWWQHKYQLLCRQQISGAA